MDEKRQLESFVLAIMLVLLSCVALVAELITGTEWVRCVCLVFAIFVGGSAAGTAAVAYVKSKSTQ